MCCAVLSMAAAESCGPSFSSSGPEASLYGAEQNYPLGTLSNCNQQDHIIASFSNFDKLLPSHVVPMSSTPSPLARTCDLTTVHYKFEGESHTLADYLARNPATGLLIARDSTILFETYQYGRRDTDRFVSHSMVKTLVSMLIGIAKADGKIRSLDDLAQDYVPELKGSGYGQTSLRALLTMSSGIAFSESYDGNDDISQLARDLYVAHQPAALLLAKYNNREAAPATRFHYASSETEVLGVVLSAATGKSLSNYASEKIWKPMGAEADATWAVDSVGGEMGFCCFNARLRDYVRLGLLLAHDGGGIIPKSWVLEATTSPGDSYRSPRKATSYYGYGYQTWLFPTKRRMFVLLGVYGQAIYVDPESKVVLVHTAARMKPSDDPAARELPWLWFGLLRELGVPAVMQ